MAGDLEVEPKDLRRAQGNVHGTADTGKVTYKATVKRHDRKQQKPYKLESVRNTEKENNLQCRRRGGAGPPAKENSEGVSESVKKLLSHDWGVRLAGGNWVSA